MTEFYSPMTGKKYTGDFPKTIKSFTETYEGETIVLRPLIINRGDPGYDEELQRWMFQQGYLTADRIDKE